MERRMQMDPKRFENTYTYVAMGVAARDEIVYNEDENPVTDLMNGKITFHQYMTPYTPAEDIEDIIEFDPDALVSALS